MLLTICATLLMAQPQYVDSILTDSLGRGVVAIRQSATEVFVTWRYLETDKHATAFDVYRDGKKLNRLPIVDRSYYVDSYAATSDATYEVCPATAGSSSAAGSYTLPAGSGIGYIEIPLDRPLGGTTPDKRPYTYTAGDASMGDVDGDGEY